MKTEIEIPIQHIAKKESPEEGEIFVYHVHGESQWFGTCKYHLDKNCTYLKRWKPGKGLGKVLMRDIEKENHISKEMRCKHCFKEEKI